MSCTRTCSIASQVRGSEGAETVGFSHGDFSLVVQTLDNSAGKPLLRAEIVEDQFAVLAQRPGDLLHGLDARAHHLPAGRLSAGNPARNNLVK
jgi:hypothetical protein